MNVMYKFPIKSLDIYPHLKPMRTVLCSARVWKTPKNALINRAKQQGGDAIVFTGYDNEIVRARPRPLDFSEESHLKDSLTVQKVMKATVLKYR